MISFIVNYGKETNYSVNVCIQSLCFGGNFANHDNGCHSWRNDLVQAVVLDAFFDPNKGEAYRFAKDWTMENDTITNGGMYSDYDRRFLWATFGKPSDPDEGNVLDTVWDKYFDSE